MTNLSLLAAGLICSLASSAASAAERPGQPWVVLGDVVGKHGKTSKDVSGIACEAGAGPIRRCLAIDDNLQAAQSVTIATGRVEAGPPVPLISNAFGGKPLELDGEGVAFADGVYYVMGSHGHPRDKGRKLDPVADRELIAARIAAASQIVRLRVGPDGGLAMQPPNLSLTSAILAQPDLRDSADRRLEQNGLTIEGVAVIRDRLFAGFRGPSLAQGRGAVLSVSLAGMLGGGGADGRLFKLKLGEGRGIRDLSALGDRILVLAGPTADGAGRYSVDLWDGATDDGIRELLDLRDAGIDGSRKAEALLPVSEDPQSFKVLILFDGEAQGAPVLVDVPNPP